jgi:hypothetical protein
VAERKAGRPPLEDETLRRERKVMLSFTQEEYDDYKNMQTLLNQATLTATLMLFIQKGRDAFALEFARQR